MTTTIELRLSLIDYEFDTGRAKVMIDLVCEEAKKRGLAVGTAFDHLTLEHVILVQGEAAESFQQIAPSLSGGVRTGPLREVQL